MDIYEVEEQLSKLRWQYAKTYPRAPHEYTVLAWNPEIKQFMVDFAHFIVDNGRDEFYYGHKFKVLDIGEYKYWTMDFPLEKTDLINRTFNDDFLKAQLSNYILGGSFVFRKGMTLEDIRREMQCQEKHSS